MPHAKLRWATAVHEAGHAVVAWGLGLSVGDLDLLDADGAGRSWIEDDAHLGTIDRIAVCAAGMEAVAVLDAGALLDVATLSQAGSSDYRKIIELLDEHPEAAHDTTVDGGHRRARDLLELHLTTLRAVAEALASAGHLETEEFASIVRGQGD